MKRAPWLWIVPWIGVVLIGAFLLRQQLEARALHQLIRAATNATTVSAQAVNAPPPLPPSARESDDSPAQPPVDWTMLTPTELVAHLGTRPRSLHASGLGAGHPDFFGSLDAALNRLSPKEWTAIVSSDQDLHFVSQYDQASVPIDEKIDAVVRWRAYQRLAEANPSAALQLTERADVKQTSGAMINLITEALQRWTQTDSSAALAWGRTRADFLPLGALHAQMALEGLARHDMTAAWAAARREGIDVLQAMPYLARAVTTREDCDAFMQEIAALQGAAPHGFVGGAHQYYTDLTAKLARSAGFDEARTFAERWASQLDWRDHAALAAVKTTFARTPNPQSFEAADWMISFTSETRRAQAVENLVSAWAEEDFTQPAEWLKNHAGAEWHDTGLAALCRRIAPFDPEAAAEWAAGISDPALRKSAFQSAP